MTELRSLVLVLGDQLDLESSAFDGFDTRVDAVWMAEVVEESTHVLSSKPRTALFLSAMRHFALALQAADPDASRGDAGQRPDRATISRRPGEAEPSSRWQCCNRQGCRPAC